MRREISQWRPGCQTLVCGHFVAPAILLSYHCKKKNTPSKSWNLSRVAAAMTENLDNGESLRMNRTMELLNNSRHTQEEITEQWGFSYDSQMWKCFRKHLGRVLLSVRKNLTENPHQEEFRTTTPSLNPPRPAFGRRPE